jgi:hypothetical protein
MAVYQIAPQTSLQDLPFEEIDVRNEEVCRKKCDSKEEDCTAFVYKHPSAKKEFGSCLLFNNHTFQSIPSPGSILFVKNGRRSYWILWLFLAMLVALIFLSRCGKPRYPSRQ